MPMLITPPQMPEVDSLLPLRAGLKPAHACQLLCCRRRQLALLFAGVCQPGGILVQAVLTARGCLSPTQQSAQALAALM